LRAAFRLAALLHRSVEELGETLSSEEFSLWLAMLEVEPMGAAALGPALAELKADLRNGPLQRQDKRLWVASDFWDARRWQPPAPPPAPPSKDSLRAFVRGVAQPRRKRR
jgi:hypothetical protein